jgi:hypothetical protein
VSILKKKKKKSDRSNCNNLKVWRKEKEEGEIKYHFLNIMVKSSNRLIVQDKMYFPLNFGRIKQIHIKMISCLLVVLGEGSMLVFVVSFVLMVTLCCIFLRYPRTPIQLYSCFLFLFLFFLTEALTSGTVKQKLK